jgi:hypothetical protein
MASGSIIGLASVSLIYCAHRNSFLVLQISCKFRAETNSSPHFGTRFSAGGIIENSAGYDVSL